MHLPTPCLFPAVPAQCPGGAAETADISVFASKGEGRFGPFNFCLLGAIWIYIPRNYLSLVACKNNRISQLFLQHNYTLQEDFLRETFNCPKKDPFEMHSVQGEQPDFIETDSETSNDSALRATGSEPDAVLVATDDELQDNGQKRSYNKRRQDRLHFLGKPVCSKSAARLLGQTTLQKLRDGQAIYTMKNRAPLPKHPSFGFVLRGDAGAKWSHVVLFLWLIYHSSAECLPTDFVSGFKQTYTKKDEKWEYLEECVFPTGPDRDKEDVIRSVHGFMRSLHQYNSDIEAHMIGPGFFRGERRHLPHGSRTEMFFRQPLRIWRPQCVF